MVSAGEEEMEIDFFFVLFFVERVVVDDDEVNWT